VTEAESVAVAVTEAGLGAFAPSLRDVA
jgi:hypothetical protein